MSILSLLAVATVPQTVVPPAPPVPPVPSSVPVPSRVLIDFTPGQVTCDGGNPQAVRLVKPAPAAVSIAADRAIARHGFTFRIDGDGRPLGIAPEARVLPGAYVTANDLQPALAASRFAPGAAQARCTIRYDAAASGLATAPIALVRRYLTLPHDSVWFEGEIRARGREVDGDCYTGKPATLLLRAYPDPDALQQPVGTMEMSVAAYDIDRSGRPVRVRTIQGDGNAAIDAEVRRAAARSRFKAGAPRTGCFLPYARRQPTPLAAPEPPPFDRAPADGCPPADTKWAYLPTLVFPRPFWQRGIEGWAVVRYDVAPWGQTGNVTVVASEPAAAFGEQARQIVTGARRTPSTRGATGCLERVRFKLPQPMDGNEPPPAPPPIFD